MPTLHRVQVVVCFNSRTPGGVRPERYCKATISILFQFTHPGRGATDLHSPRSIARDVSIHAPREGCDVGGRYMDIVTRKFQFTHPGRGATRAVWLRRSIVASFNSRTPGGVRPVHVLYLDEFRDVSIHAPREGCDYLSEECGVWEGVSIHAPREGCDLFVNLFRPFTPCFNSRTPGGVRLRDINLRRPAT